MSHLEEIKAKISIEELVGGYVQLKKAGRNLKGLCPFHNDSRPSFMVSPEKGIGYCFSCNTGGDIFKFIQLVEKVDFPEAVRILAERTGVQLSTFNPQVQDERMTVLKANQKAAEFFHAQLQNDNKALDYFKKRGLGDETIARFQLGVSPDSYQATKEHLIGQGFKEKELLVAGLVNQRSVANQHTYDRFRGRLMFPIADHQGNVVGFGGRILDEGEPKYLNSPDTPAYNKSFVLYGLHLAKEEIKKKDMAIVVEGYMDVITAHQAGCHHVVATSGTALTAGQLRLIKRYTKNIAFAFDQDTAGQEATKRAIEIAQEAELEVKIILIPDGKDPDECIRQAPEKWFQALDEAVSVIDFYFSLALEKHDKNTLEGRKAIAAFLLPIIRTYPTTMEQNEYLNRLALELRTDVKLLWQDMAQINLPRPLIYESKPVETSPEARRFNREEYLLGFILNYPNIYPHVHQQLIDSIAFDPGTERIYKALKKVYDSKRVVTLVDLEQELPQDVYERLQVLTLLVDEHYSELNEGAIEKEVLSLIQSINRNNLKAAQKAFEFRIRSESDAMQRNALLKQYSEILKLSSKLN